MLGQDGKAGGLMGGLLILVLIGLYIWATKKAIYRVQPAWGKALVVLTAVLLPTTDAVYGRFKLRQMCEAEGGLRIFRVVEGVAGFENPKGSPLEQWIRNGGFRFIEGTDPSGKPSRMSLQVDGTVALEVGVAPISEYVYGDTHGNSDDIYYRIEKAIRVRKTGEVLSRTVNFSYAGGWAERLIAGVYASRGQAGTCGQDISITELVTKTLKPIK